MQVRARDGVEDAFAAMKQQRADAVSVVLGGPTFEYYADVTTIAVRNRLPTAKGLTIRGSSPEELGSATRAQLAKYARVMKEANIRND